MTASYPDDWQEIASAIKKAAGWKCVRCEAEHWPEGGYCLTVHHLTGEKSDCRWWNLAALCQRCHLSIQGRVNMFQMYPFEHSEWFKPYAAGWYAFKYLGEEITREQAVERQAELLDLERFA